MKSSTITFTLSLVIIIAGVLLALFLSGKPSKYTAFAECVTESGTVFYGSATCPHCIDQKRDFGNAADLLNYVECNPQFASPEELAQCEAAGVEGVPHWTSPEGDVFTGRQQMEVLAAISSCELPEDHTSAIQVQMGDGEVIEAEVTNLADQEA